MECHFWVFRWELRVVKYNLTGHILYFIPLQYAAACNVTSEDGIVVKERECLGRCGEHGHQISYGGENLTAYFCRPRGSRRDDDSDIDGIREHYEDFMIDPHDPWDSEFGDDRWSDGGVDEEDEDWWGVSDDEEEEDNWGSFGDDDDDSWWRFGDNDGGNGWWPSGGDDDNSWWDSKAVVIAPLVVVLSTPVLVAVQLKNPMVAVPRLSQWPMNLECRIVYLASVLLFWIFDITWTYSSKNNPSLLSEATQSMIDIFASLFYHETWTLICINTFQQFFSSNMPDWILSTIE